MNGFDSTVQPVLRPILPGRGGGETKRKHLSLKENVVSHPEHFEIKIKTTEGVWLTNNNCIVRHKRQLIDAGGTKVHQIFG